MAWINGSDLTPRQREQVLSAFIYRWTVDNFQRERCYANIPRPHNPLISDVQWLQFRRFHFIKDGSRLSLVQRYSVCFGTLTECYGNVPPSGRCNSPV